VWTSKKLHEHHLAQASCATEESPEENASPAHSQLHTHLVSTSMNRHLDVLSPPQTSHVLRTPSRALAEGGRPGTGQTPQLPATAAKVSMYAQMRVGDVCSGVPRTRIMRLECAHGAGPLLSRCPRLSPPAGALSNFLSSSLSSSLPPSLHPSLPPFLSSSCRRCIGASVT